MTKRRLDIKIEIKTTESLDLATSVPVSEKKNVHDLLRDHLIFIQGANFGKLNKTEVIVSLNIIHMHLCLFKSLITEENDLRDKLCEITQQLILAVKSLSYYELFYAETIEFLNV